MKKLRPLVSYATCPSCKVKLQWKYWVSFRGQQFIAFDKYRR